MFKQLPPLVGVPLRYGLIAGLIGSIFLIILYYIGNHPLLIFPFFDPRIILFIVFIFFSLKELRDYYFSGILYFWQGMISCFILALVFAILVSGMLTVFASAEPDFIHDYVVKFTERARANYPQEAIERIGKEQFEQNLRDLPKTATPFSLGITYFFWSMVISFFISTIISVILRRQPKTL